MTASPAPPAASVDTPVLLVDSRRQPDGSYQVVVLVSPADRPPVELCLSPGMARRYAEAVIAAATRAAYEAAVLAQLVDRGVEVKAAARVVVGMRETAPPLDHEATAPLAFTPIVAHGSLSPMVDLQLHGEDLGTLDLASARSHGYHLLDVVIGAELDAEYCRYLIGHIGVDEVVATNQLADLGCYRFGYDVVETKPDRPCSLAQNQAPEST